MRRIITLTVTAALACAAPGLARAQIPQQLLQGLLPNGQGGNQNAEQAVRDAYERGYRQGRQDQEQADRARYDNGRQQQQGGSYPDQGQGNSYQRSPYTR